MTTDYESPKGDLAASMLENQSMLIMVKFSKPGTRKKVSNELVDVDTDKEALHVSKDIFECAEFAAIRSFDGNIRRKLADIALPAKTLAAGIYRFGNKAITKAQAILDDAIYERRDLVEAFLEAYPYIVEGAEARLKALYDPSDYPEANTLAKSFDMDYQIMGTHVPEMLKTLSKTAYEAESQKARLKLATEMEQIRAALRLQMLELVTSLQEATTPDENGKTKRFNESKTSNLLAFVKNLEDRNVSGDTELSEIATKAAEVLKGLDADKIRKLSAVRDYVSNNMAAIKDEVAKLTENVPVRQFGHNEL